MTIRFFIILPFSLMALSSATAQQKLSCEEYIDLYKNIAIEEMEDHHIPASITLAQGILESNCGNSPLALLANNHFGIKCHKDWNGKTFYQDDDEKNECFRKYNKVEESFRDHSDFLVTRDRYRFLFDMDITDYKGWAHGLKKAGYATNPKYPDLLIKIIEENRLDVFDKVGSRQPAVSSQQPVLNAQQEGPVNGGRPEVFEIAGKGGNNRIIFINNGVKFVYAREGDDLLMIAAEFEIYSWQLYRYNDLLRSDRISSGQKIYLERKKGKSDYNFHIVQGGENLHSISQDYGIRLKSLCQRNSKKAGDKVIIGEKLRLK